MMVITPRCHCHICRAYNPLAEASEVPECPESEFMRHKIDDHVAEGNTELVIDWQVDEIIGASEAVPIQDTEETGPCDVLWQVAEHQCSETLVGFLRRGAARGAAATASASGSPGHALSLRVSNCRPRIGEAVFLAARCSFTGKITLRP